MTTTNKIKSDYWVNHTIGFGVGAISACGAVTFTNPWEVIKTRLQLQGELQILNKNEKTYNNVLSAFVRIFKTEGIRGIQKGLGPAYIYQVLMNGTRLGMYEPLKQRLFSLFALSSSTVTFNNYHHLSNHLEEVALYAAMIGSGAFSGALGAMIASPFFMIKTRMQSFSPSTPSIGYQHTYINQGTFKALSIIYKTEGGISGLWRGMDVAMVRTGIGSAVQLSTYDQTKRFLLSTGFYHPQDISLHFSASMLTSLFVCLAMNPFDVASTRMYNQKTAVDGKHGALYINGLDCIVKTVRSEGISALYKGFSAHYLRVGPHTVLTFVFLEQLKALANKLF